MRRVSPGLALAAASLSLLLAAPAGAVAFGTAPVTVELGDGMRARRVPAPCSGVNGVGFGVCGRWSVEGFNIPAELPVGDVRMFARARGGRVAMATAAGLWLSDDRGARWSRARMDSPVTPVALAFDADSDFGAAVGPNGTVWTTQDRGDTWRVRRDRSGPPLVDVVVSGRALAFSDALGGVWVSFDEGVSVRTLCDVARGRMPVMAVHRGSIWIHLEGRRWWRVDANGTLEEVARSPWGA
ncbi:MAG: hypothetical protein R3A48_22180 [Polyangiales bacterium]